MAYLSAARKGATIFGGLYAAAILAVMIPYIQTQCVQIYLLNNTRPHPTLVLWYALRDLVPLNQLVLVLQFLHALKIPLFSDYNTPEKYGLAPNKTANLKISTADGELLGAWFILADQFYHSLPSHSAPPVEHVGAALKARPTVLFFHGNAGTRAFGARIQHYTTFSSRLSANVLAIDYRGYGDSTGTPSEVGLARDARAAWNWLIDNGALASDILIVGHSLGTGVSSLLSAELSDEEIAPKGVVLLSPFSSISKVVETYSMLGIFPLIRPLASIPRATEFLMKRLIHKFDTDKLVPRMKGQIIIAHAGECGSRHPGTGSQDRPTENDWDIPYTHSEALFTAFLDPHLPQMIALPPHLASLSQEQWSEFTSRAAERREAREALVSTTEIPKFGTLHKFNDGKRTVTHVQTLHGGHDYVGIQEGVSDIIGQTFGFF
ncbi:unnamed protein product [Mycena citricolor]|uniref:AB hydrolase-1 domain-containing protein n=1 Tax=Mycena citricolor TaxID=2018698 RepID=A0AAD2H7F8_9AGAR|nr:unnamed protein product [Mycena citricolor]